MFPPRSKESHQPPPDWTPKTMDKGGEEDFLQHPWRFVMEGDEDGETSKSLFKNSKISIEIFLYFSNSNL